MYLLLIIFLYLYIGIAVAAEHGTAKKAGVSLTNSAQLRNREESRIDPLWRVSRGNRVVIKVGDEVVRESLPKTLFGFNINYALFQEQLWNASTRSPKPEVLDQLMLFSGALYRYPGGLVANRFDWTKATGLHDDRPLQKPATVYPPAAKIAFGIDEYLRFISKVNGEGLYVLNLVGPNSLQSSDEYDDRTLAKHNQELVKHLRNPLQVNSRVQYYELGNELDRGEYQWTHEKYVKRSLAVINAIKEVDKDARFIAFLRDFTLKFKNNSARADDPPESFITDVMRGLPMVQDYSIHHYYDEQHGSKTGPPIRNSLERMAKSIETYKSVRNGQVPRVWITEHARQINEGPRIKHSSVEYLSNLSSALSTADYLISLAQFSEVQGACWHGLNAAPWQVFDVTFRHRDLRPTPIYLGLRVLRAMDLPVVLATRTSSTNISNYQGGYDVRGVGFRDNDSQALGVWIVNRANQQVQTELEYLLFKGAVVSALHTYLAGPKGVDPDALQLEPSWVSEPTKLKMRFSGTGTIVLDLPPSSISTFVFRKQTQSSGNTENFG